MKRRTLRVLLAMLVALPVAALAEPASAAPVDLVCPFAMRVDLNPGLTLFPQTIQIGGQANAGTTLSPLTPCTSVLTGVPYVGASGPVIGSGTLACVTVGAAGLTGSASGTVPLTFDNGDTGTINWSITLGGAVPVVTGTISGGTLDGSTLALIPAGVTGLTGNCLLAPVTSFTIVGLAVVIRL
jgi:hypothetical protein